MGNCNKVLVLLRLDGLGYQGMGWVIRKLRAKTNFRNLSLTLLIPGVYHIR